MRYGKGYLKRNEKAEAVGSGASRYEKDSEVKTGSLENRLQCTYRKITESPGIKVGQIRSGQN